MSTPNVAPNVPVTSTNASDWFSGEIPGGDLPFDDLFAQPAEPVAQPTPAQPPAPAAAEPQAPAPQPPATPEPFLKAGSTVYNTREEAERSLAYKDQVVERLRNLEIQRTGIDPLTGKPVAPTPQGPVSYRTNQGQYFDDLMQAVTKNDRAKYFEAQQKLIYDTLEPIAPLISDFSKQQAVSRVAQEIKDFTGFLQSKEYTDTLEVLPELKAAIQYAESDLNFANRLDQLYKTAFWAAQGRKTPELVQAAAQAATAAPAQPPRPTTTPATMTPPAPGAPPSLNTSEGRKALIAQMESKLQDVKW